MTYTKNAVDAILAIPTTHMREKVRGIAERRANQFPDLSHDRIGRNDIADAVRRYYIARDIHEINLESDNSECVTISYTLPEEALNLIESMYGDGKGD